MAKADYFVRESANLERVLQDMGGIRLDIVREMPVYHVGKAKATVGCYNGSREAQIVAASTAQINSLVSNLETRGVKLTRNK